MPEFNPQPVTTGRPEMEKNNFRHDTETVEETEIKSLNMITHQAESCKSRGSSDLAKTKGWWWQRWGQPPEEEDIFAHEDGHAVQYKTLHWLEVGALMITETISLGILSLPQAIATLGLGPGIFCIVILGMLAWCTGREIGKFKEKYPAVNDMADAGRFLFGRGGGILLSIAQLTVFIFIMAAHLTSFSVMMNVLTEHKHCTVLYGALGLLVSVLLGTPRTLKSQTFCSILSCVSVTGAIMITLMNVTIGKKINTDYVLVGQENFPRTMIALLNIIMSFSGHVAFFGFASELKKPRDFKKAVSTLMVVSTVFYCIVGGVIYTYVGPSVPSPALGAASPLVRKIAYGVATPTIVIAGVVNGHVASKHLYFKVWRGTQVPHQTNWKSVTSWFGIVTAVWTTAFVLAQSLPDFHHLLALVSAMFCGWFSFGLTGFFYLYRNWEDIRVGKKVAGAVFNCGIILMGFLICALGLYASGTAISNGEAGKPWACADNSLAELGGH